MSLFLYKKSWYHKDVSSSHNGIYKIPNVFLCLFFGGTRIVESEMYMEEQRATNSRTVLNKEQKVRGSCFMRQ